MHSPAKSLTPAAWPEGTILLYSLAEDIDDSTVRGLQHHSLVQKSETRLSLAVQVPSQNATLRMRRRTHGRTAIILCDIRSMITSLRLNRIVRRRNSLATVYFHGNYCRAPYNQSSPDAHVRSGATDMRFAWKCRKGHSRSGATDTASILARF